LTKRLVRLFAQPDVHDALGNCEPVAVSPDEKDDLAKMVDISTEVLDAIQTPTLIVIDESGRAIVDDRLAVSGDEEFIDPKPLVEFLERYKPRLDAEVLLAVALQQAQQQNKRVFLKQTSAYSRDGRMMSKLLQDHALLFDSEYVIVSIDANRFAGGRAVMQRYRPRDGRLPWVAILDATGAVLITSDGPDGPIGFPTNGAGISYFMHMLESTVQRATPQQLQPVRQTLAQRVRRN